MRLLIHQRAKAITTTTTLTKPGKFTISFADIKTHSNSCITIQQLMLVHRSDEVQFKAYMTTFHTTTND
ncbi:CLUMA_CG003887, isoform A [Clunio marinus]|uniref:CLUMA_CG003887, isoform A n=1 Tax=Clunio marinus TaxID=568069 RepID=A0A1J1HQ56_9DIPT|nr:CLUMA_CG003887, isoform A [Clunio marinus]